MSGKYAARGGLVALIVCVGGCEGVIGPLGDAGNAPPAWIDAGTAGDAGSRDAQINLSPDDPPDPRVDPNADAAIDAGVRPSPVPRDAATPDASDASTREGGGIWLDAGYDANFDAGWWDDAGVDAAVVVDAGVQDSAAVDAGVHDAGATDASAQDAAVADAGSTDPGAQDAAVVDAGSVDAGESDSGSADAGVVDAGSVDTGTPDAGAIDPEPGRLAGIVEAHNVVRRAVDPGNPLPDLAWNPSAAAFAQSWADTLASDCSFRHSSGSGYGENLAYFGPSGWSTAEIAVQGWASEVDCWTYGTIDYPPRYPGTEQCDATCVAGLNSNGCGHYTQIVWRQTTSVGCGVASCAGGSADIWVCSYAPAGNYAQQYPY